MLNTMKFVTFKTLLSILWIHCEAYSFSDEQSLHTTIFNSSYDNNMRPGQNRTIPLQINITFYFKSIKEFDESVSKFSITGALEVSWLDHRLTWDPATYGGDLNVTIIPQKKVWIPFLVNMLMYDALEEVGHSDLNVRLESSGCLTWVSPNIFESTCDADLSYYPFDYQTCFLRFYIPGFMPNEVDLVPVRQTMDLVEYIENALWDVTETKVYTTIDNLKLQELVMSVTMKRRSVYYISSLVLPVAFLSILQLAVFFMPPESGERVGFVTTVLLAVAVYLTLIQDKLPEGSEPSVAYLSYKLLGDFMVGVLMTIGVIIGLIFYNREDGVDIPNYLRTFHKLVLGRKLCLTREKRKIAWTDNDAVMDSTVVEKVADDDVRSNESSPLVTWREIGQATDRFCLIMFGFVLINCNLIYIVVIATIN